MSLHVASPTVLAGLLAVPVFLLAAHGPWAARVCRALATTALVLVLAGVALERDRPAAGTCVVAVIDVSASVGEAAVARARETLGGLLPWLEPRDLVGSVAFAGHARVVAAPAPPPPEVTGLLPVGQPDDDDAHETDVASAITLASALCPAGRQPALVLFTDGNETLGDVLAQLLPAGSSVPVFPDPPVAALPEVGLRRLLAPGFAPAGTVAPLTAVVEARSAVSVAVAVEVDGRSEMPQPRALAPGYSVVPVSYRVGAPGDHRIDARLLVPPDRPPPVGHARDTITVTAPLHALVVSERPASPVVALALERQGMEVVVVSPVAFAAESRHLERWHAVVLDDVARAGLPTSVLEALTAWVAGGGALVVTGGEHLFGDPGFVGSALAHVLPVALVSQTPEPEEREPIGLYLLIDRSNSMADGGAQGTPKIEYARRAALEVLEQLEPADVVGAIAFDSDAYELGALAPVAQARGVLAAKIQHLRPGGGTDFLAALERAGHALENAGPAVRHVILLTDGDSNRRADDHDAVLAALAEANVSVTTIRIGTDTANLDFLQAIARVTGGEFHHVTDLQTLPQLMIRDTQRKMDAASGRHDARARLVGGAPLLTGLSDRDLPPVARWALTRARPGAQVRMVVEAGARQDPLLATWQYELGRVAVVPLDFQASAAGWAAWPGFTAFLGRIVLWAAPRGLSGDRHARVRRVPAGSEILIETIADLPGPLVVTLADREVALRPAGRRRFTAVVPTLPVGPLHAELRDVAGGRTPLELDVPAAGTSGREGRTLGVATARLEALARRTGGRMRPSPDDLVAARGGVAKESRSLDGWLVPLALVCLLIDIALRRPGQWA